MTTAPQHKKTRTTPAAASKPLQRVKSAKEEVVIKSFEDLMIDNAAKLRECSDRYNALVVSSEAKDRDHVAFLNLLHDQIGKALGTHTTVATAINDDKQVSPAEIEEAVAATAVVEQLEDEWKKGVDKTLADHESRIGALEGKNKVPTLAPVPTPEPEAAPKIEVVEQKLDATPAQTVRTQYINIQQWRGLAWILALIGFGIGAIITLNVWGGFFPGAMGAMAWVRYATLLMIPFIGFFIGGSIGSYVESRREVEVERELIVVE